MTQERIQVIHPFPPLYDDDSRVLILGSFPSVRSRELSFYYAHPQNRFWKIMSLLYDETITDRADFCHRHHIALWDVIYSCTICGSSDSSIRDVVVNPVEQLAERTGIRHIFTTGMKADRLYMKYIHTGITHTALPSTSAANAAMRTDDLLTYYRVIREITDEED